MVRRLLAIAFVLAAFAPEAVALAQQSTQSSGTHSTASHANSSKTTASAHHSAPPNARNHHHGNVPPWSNSVYVNGGSAAQYLATATPKPAPPKNKVKTGGSGQEVFKSIGN